MQHMHGDITQTELDEAGTVGEGKLVVEQSRTYENKEVGQISTKPQNAKGLKDFDIS